MGPTPTSPAPDASAAPRALWVALLFATLLAGALRATGLGHGLPDRPEPDSGVVRRQVLELQRGVLASSESPSDRREYPLLLARATALVLGARQQPAAKSAARVPTEKLATQAAHPLLVQRAVSAALATLVVPATFLLGRGLIGSGPALVAALQVGLSLLHLLFSQQGRPHGPASLTILLAVVAAVRLRRAPSPLNWALAGAAAGLAIGTLQSGLSVLPALALAALLRERAPRRGRTATLAGLGLAVLALWAVAGYLVPANSAVIADASPSALEREAFGEPRAFFGHLVYPGAFRGGGFATIAHTLWTFEPLLVASLAVALAFLAARLFGARARGPAGPAAGRRRDLAVVLAHALPYGLVVGLYDRSFERFVLPLLPYLALLGAWGLARLAHPWAAGAPHRGRRARRALALLAALLLAPQLAADVRYAAQRARPDAAARVARWMEAELDPRTCRIQLLPGLEVPVGRTPEALAADAALGWTTPWRLFLIHEAAARAAVEFDLRIWPLGRPRDLANVARAPREAFRELGVTHVLLTRAGRRFDEGGVVAVRAWLRQSARLLHADPDPAPDAPPLVYQARPDANWTPWLVHFLGRQPLGEDRIELYELPPAPDAR